MQWSAMRDIAGNRKPQPLDAAVVEALRVGQVYNPVQYQEGVHYYILVPEADGGHRKQYLGKALEGHRFALGCDCEEEHCFYETLHNFTNRQDRLCKFCSSITGMWEAANKKKVSEAENKLMAMMRELAVDRQVACEVALPWWHGRIDFYHMPSKTAVQVDGSGHFEGTHHMMPSQQLQADLQCCRAAWMARGRLLRVHHRSARVMRALLDALSLPHARFVMVSMQYTTVSVTWKGMTKSYTDWLECVLVGSKCYFDKVTNCAIYY